MKTDTLSELCTNAITQEIGVIQGTTSNAYTTSDLGIATIYTGNGLMSQLTNSFTIQNAINDDMTDEQIKERLESLVKDFTQLVDLIGKRELQNKQWCLDGLDEINKQSVRY